MHYTPKNNTAVHIYDSMKKEECTRVPKYTPGSHLQSFS